MTEAANDCADIDARGDEFRGGVAAERVQIDGHRKTIASTTHSAENSVPIMHVMDAHRAAPDNVGLLDAIVRWVQLAAPARTLKAWLRHLALDGRLAKPNKRCRPQPARHPRPPQDPEIPPGSQ